MQADFSQTETIKVYPYMEWGLGGLGLVLVLFPAFIATATGHYLMGMSFFFLAFCCVLLVIRGRILLVNDRFVAVMTLLGRNQMSWDEVEEIETSPNEEIVLHGSSVDALKTLVIPGKMYWFEHTKQIGAIFSRQVKVRQIHVRKSTRSLWFVFSSETTRVDMNVDDPRTYATAVPETYESMPTPAAVAKSPMLYSPQPAPNRNDVIYIDPRFPSEREIFIESELSMKNDPSLDVVLGAVAASVAAVFAAVAWSGIAFFTRVEFTIAAVGVGVLVGHGTKLFSPKGNTEMGVISACFTMGGCILGHSCAIVMAATRGNLFEVGDAVTMFATQPELLLYTYAATFHPLHLLFYLVAVIYSFRAASQ